MALPWMFGVEMEFCVAFIYPRPVPLPDPAETRRLRFKPLRGEIDEAINAYSLPPITSTAELANETVYKEAFFGQLMAEAVQRDIAQMLHEAGFPVNRSHPDEEDVSNWQIGEDGSINRPGETSYHWTGVEVKSPALAFNEQNLKAVEEVCNLITKNYVVNVNRTCGLHIHVSAGLETNFRLETMQNLFAICWAFETPQLDSLHPPNRQNSYYARSTRNDSIFTDLWWKQYGQLPTLAQGVVELLKKDDLLELITAVCYVWKGKTMRYNPLNMFKLLDKTERGRLFRNPPRTIEFRQHEGTLEPERIRAWITTVVGIINFADTTDQDSLKQLFRKAEDDEWTVIDLFRSMHLGEQADYYQDKLNPVVAARLPRRPTVWKWEYEELKSKGQISDDEYQEQHQLRLLWEQSLTASLAQPKSVSSTFDPDDQMWPKHVRVNKWPPKENDHNLSDNEVNALFDLLSDKDSDLFSEEDDQEGVQEDDKKKITRPT
jgi:hypothetical protein